MKKLLVVLAVLAGIVLSGCVREENNMILSIYNKVGDFANGETITGQTSGATGIAVTKNEPASLLCCGQTNPSNIFSPYFSAIYYNYEPHDPSSQLCLNDVQGTFGDEKIVGQTSGAYAWTYETSWTEFSRESGNQYLGRGGQSNDGYDAAKSDYENDPAWLPQEPGNDLILIWKTTHSLPTAFAINASQIYLKFDTRAIGEVEGAKIKFSGISYQHDWDTYPILQIYEHNYNEPFGSGDWTGGTKIKEIEYSGQTEVDIDPIYVNAGGYSKYRFTLKSITDRDYAPAPDVGNTNEMNIVASTVKLAIR